MPLTPPDPTQIDEFRIIRRIGQGGMGIVYLADDTLLNRQVAVKVLADHLTGSEQALGRFRDEAKTAAALKNPGIVPVYKFGFDGRRHYIVSEYVPGSTFKGLIAQEAKRRGSADTSGAEKKAWRIKVAEMLAKIAEALEHSHRADVVHRDVKPSNILVDTIGNPRLTDFGIAKHIIPEVSMEFTEGLGSCHYMSPEQAAISGSRVDRRSDIFSLGVVLYEGLALRKPFDGDSPEHVLHAVRTRDPLALRLIDPALPKDLETICHKALEKDPNRRYQSAMHMAADLRCLLEGAPIMARPASPARRVYRWTHKHRVPLIATLIAILTMGLGITSWSVNRAHNATFAWVTIDSQTSGMPIYIQEVDRTTFVPAAAEPSAGTTPLRSLKLPKGQYRITVVSPDAASFVEFNAILLNPGPENSIVLLAQNAAPAQAPSSASPASVPYNSRALAGILEPTSGVIEDMVLVKEGDYPLGRDDGTTPLYRKRTVHLDAFYIDRAPVTNGQYQEFIKATGHPPPPHWRTLTYTDRFEQYPVVDITQHDAEAYARWRGKRLPTILEWQAAARGTASNLYPWGNERDFSRLPPCSDEDRELWRDSREDVRFQAFQKNALLAQNREHLGHWLQLTHLFGPVRHITGSLDDQGDDAVLAGRAWSDPPTIMDLGTVLTFPRSGRNFGNGFRCAKSAAPPAPSQAPRPPSTSARSSS